MRSFLHLLDDLGAEGFQIARIARGDEAIVGDDFAVSVGVSFPKIVKAKPGETVVFAYITYKSRAHRDKVNAKVMKDPRIATMCDPKKMPFDCKRMAYGGFKILVNL